MAYALIDTGASCSAISFKFSQTEAIQSLNLVFKKRIKTIKLAEGKETQTSGFFEDIPFEVDNFNSPVSAHNMNNMSYELILGRDWCEANGVIIFLNNNKIFLIKPDFEKDYEIISEMSEILPNSDLQKYAHLT